jgi:hypothetical protein
LHQLEWQITANLMSFKSSEIGTLIPGYFQRYATFSSGFWYAGLKFGNLKPLPSYGKLKPRFWNCGSSQGLAVAGA